MGDYRVPNGGQYKSTSNGEIVLGIPDDLTEKRISEVVLQFEIFRKSETQVYR